MRRITKGALLASLLDVACAQCGCSATTALTSPSIYVPGPPTWVVTGTITNPSTLDGVCPREGCVNVRQCQHDLVVNLSVTFPYVPPPAVPLPLPRADVLFSTVKWQLQWNGGQDNSNGTATLTSCFPVSLFTECTSTGDSSATFELQWTGPDGAVIRSGSTTIKCRMC